MVSSLLGTKKADMKIQQMTFMILFVFIFFSFAGLFFISIQSGKITQSYNTLQKESAVASIETIANMPELNCDSSRRLCLDEDKIITFSMISKEYKNFLPVESIIVRRIYPKSSGNIRCPGVNCSYYQVYNSNQTGIIYYGTFVSLCKKVRNERTTQDICELGRLEVGVKIKS
jgi:hypothetical protein